MWRGHRRALAEYILACFRELTKRGRHYQSHIDEVTKIRDESPDTGMPSWYNDNRLYSSHRSNLLRKKPEWYGKFGWTEKSDMEYYWPN